MHLNSRSPRTLFLGAVMAALGLAGCGSSPLPVPETPPAAPAGAAPESRTSPPQEPHGIDLATALRVASGRHLDVLEARARTKEAQGNAQSADGYLLPIIGVGGLWGQTKGTAQASFGNLGTVNFGSLNALGTIQISANVGESIYQDLAAHRLAEAAEGFELAQLQRTLLEVAEDYVSLVEGDVTVRIHEQFVQEASLLVVYTHARELQGLGPTLDTERARVQSADAEQRLLSSRNERQLRSKKLATALRLDSSIELSPIDRDLAPASIASATDTLPQWLARAQEHRPEMRAYRQNLEALDQQASAARWALWGPQVGAGVLYGQVGSYPATLGERENWLVTLGWSFSFGGPGRIQAADARTEQAAIQLLRFQDRLQGQVAGAYQEVLLTRQRLDPAERELASAEKALRLARVTFEGGTLPENDLLLAQQAADQARQRRLTAVTRYNVSQIHLLAEAGIASIDSFAGGAGK